ncbi:hypothetical protein AAG906_023284 [Vitis piasezkii]
MVDSASSSSSLPLNTMVHMLTIKLTSSNYLLWKNQFVPLLASQDLFGYLDGSIRAPSATILAADGTTKSNPAYTSWLHTDQTLLSLLYSSLTEESMSEVLGLHHSHEAWHALEVSFSHRSKTRELPLLSFPVPSKVFVINWLRSVVPLMTHIKFTGAKKGKNQPPTSSSSSANSKSSSTVHYQLCDKDGHLAKCCWSFLKLKKKQSANIAEAFSSCSIQDLNDSEWFPDSGATSHMTSDTEVVDQPALYSGNERVMVGNGQSLAISHTGSISSLIPSILPYRIRSQEPYWESEDVKMVSTCWIVVIMPLCPPLLLHRISLYSFMACSPWSSQLSYCPISVEPLSDFAASDSTFAPSVSFVPRVTTSNHPMITRGKVGTSCSQRTSGFKSLQNTEWLSTMDDEIQALKTNDTWVHVPRPTNHNVVGSSQGMSCGSRIFSIHSLDFGDTFSLVVHCLIKIILSLAVTSGWRLHQLDVKNAFLHGFLNEEVYMEQPPGYTNPQFPQHADSSLFVYHSSVGTIYLLLYVDDMTITRSNSSMVQTLITRLSKEFSTKDLGDHYFLGIEVQANEKGLFLSALQYLTITRLDLSFSVNSICQFMHAPTEDHFRALKRILRYVKGTPHHGLQLHQQSTHDILAYSMHG